ncbi:hypothetical protein Salat_0662300 [Sesamum alatum]|uniref:FBD domain-containing protein n=1 Tax=Sesamum alatum TaxID=300844 RepID=A0AAE1YS23_9LAMI|nr:hypothetical protein Salat_0662300 [Sesamum alatum]
MVPEFEIYPGVDHWLQFLSNHHVEELGLESYDIDQPMPYHLFTFDHLAHLYLTNVQIKLPPAFKGFSSLLRLELQNVYIAPWEFKKLISKCPSLEYMDLDDLDCDTGELEIDAPNLNLLASLADFATFEPYEIDWNMIEVLGKLSSLEADGGFLQFLARGGVPQKLPTNLNHLRVLSLSHIGFEHIVEVKCALCLIRSSPNLQSLKIISEKSSDADMETTTRYLKAQQKHKIPLRRLKIVMIWCISGREPEMEFVKLLLLTATALRKLEFGSAYEAKEEARSNMLKQLVSFRRASPKAQIIFRDNGYPLS